MFKAYLSIVVFVLGTKAQTKQAEQKVCCYAPKMHVLLDDAFFALVENENSARCLLKNVADKKTAGWRQHLWKKT